MTEEKRESGPPRLMPSAYLILLIIAVAAILTIRLACGPGDFHETSDQFLLPEEESRQVSPESENDPASESPTNPPPDASISIDKSDRKLELLSGGKVLKTYRIVLGPAPRGDKEREGDGKTPLGEFYICTRNPKSRFTLFLGISYPNREDAERGLKAGLITQAQYEAICKAIDARRKPPWDTPLGGEIGIHGGGTHRDWTAGCVALDDDGIRELWNLVPLGTPVMIQE